MVMRRSSQVVRNRLRGLSISRTRFRRVPCQLRTPRTDYRSDLGMAARLSEIEPNVVHFITCMAKAHPGCPHIKAEDTAKLVEEKTGIKVILGTNDHHEEALKSPR